MPTERDRLAVQYASMTDGELEKLAREAMSLSEDAVRALSDELRRRKLDFELAEPKMPIKQVEQLDLVTIRQFRDMPEALLAKGALESAGIECFFVDDNMVRLDWFISNLLGGVKLAVKAEDEEAAVSVLDQPIPEAFDAEGEEYIQPKCPKCGSLNIRDEGGMEKGVALTGLYVAAIPIPVSSDVWKCDSCGAEWREEVHDQSDEPSKPAF